MGQFDPVPLKDIVNLTPLPDAFSPKAAADALGDQREARNAALLKSVEVNNKNTAVLSNVQTQVDQLDQETIDATENLGKIAQWGGDNAVTKIYGLFDSKYNLQFQKTRIEEAQLKKQQAVAKGQTQISINSGESTVADLKAKIATEDYTFQTQLLDFGTKIRDLDQKELQTKINVANLDMSLDKALQEKVKFAIGAMTSQQAQAEFKRAQKGEGDFAKFPGYLQSHIDDEKKADLSLTQLEQAVKKGDLDLADQAGIRFAKAVPLDTSQALLDTAMKSGNPNIELPNGQKIPMPIFMQGMKERNELETSVRQLSLNNSNQELGRLADTTMTAISSLATMDPEAAQLMNTGVVALRNLDAKNYNSVAQTRTMLTNIQDRAKEITKRVASAMPDPQSKAAIEQYGTTGQFTAEGATAVVKANAGRPAETSRNLYSSANDVLNNNIASKMREQNYPQMPTFKAGDPASTAAMMAWASRNAGRVKIDDIKEEALADPVVSNQMRAQVSHVQSNLAISQTLNSLATNANDPNRSVWANALTYSKRGDSSTDGLIDLLEGEYAMSGGKLDFTRTFLDTVRTTAQPSGNAAVNPLKTPSDKALEMHLFGFDPTQSILSTFVNELEVTAKQKHEETLRKIQADRAGVPQQNAAQSILSAGGDPAGMAAAAQSAPSTSVPSTTADRMRAIFRRQ